MSTEELKQNCVKVLRDAGAPDEYSKFFADVVQTESDIDSGIHQIHGKLSPDHEHIADPEHLLTTIQDLTKGYNGWKTDIDGLTRRSKVLPPLQLDAKHLKNSPAIKALCSIRTKDLNVHPGDEMKIIDTTIPNQLKVRTNHGEGYIPLLSCLLPSPDKNAITAPDRLKLQLLASWRDSMNKSKACLVKCLVETAKELNQQWQSKMSIHSTGAKERVSRRLRKLMESLNTQLPNWDLTRLHNALFSIEKELTSWNGTGSANMYGPLFVRDIEPVINTIASLDKTVLCYQMFRKQWFLYRRSLEQCPRPMRVVDNVNQLRTIKSHKNFRYYEVKVTREEVETVEEIVETSKPRSTVQAEQMTQSSAEERRKFVITGVIDPRSGEEISFQDAVNARIIDQARGMYLNPNTGGGMSIPEAMNEGRIKVGSSTAEVTKEETKAVGLITIRSRVEKRHLTIKEVKDAVTGKIMSLDEAKSSGIIDETNTHYTISNTGEKLELEQAIQGGWVTVEKETAVVSAPEYETKTYAVNAVVDQIHKKKIPFAEAVTLGLIDRDTGNYVNNVTGEEVYVTEAIKRGFLKAHEVDSADGLNIDIDNKVVVERMERMRRSVLRSVGVIRAFKMGKKKPGEPKSPEPPSSPTPKADLLREGQEVKENVEEKGAEDRLKAVPEEVKENVEEKGAEDRLKAVPEEVKENGTKEEEKNAERLNAAPPPTETNLDDATVNGGPVHKTDRVNGEKEPVKKELEVDKVDHEKKPPPSEILPSDSQQQPQEDQKSNSAKILPILPIPKESQQPKQKESPVKEDKPPAAVEVPKTPAEEKTSPPESPQKTKSKRGSPFKIRSKKESKKESKEQQQASGESGSEPTSPSKKEKKKKSWWKKKK